MHKILGSSSRLVGLSLLACCSQDDKRTPTSGDSHTSFTTPYQQHWPMVCTEFVNCIGTPPHYLFESQNFLALHAHGHEKLKRHWPYLVPGPKL